MGQIGLAATVVTLPLAVAFAFGDAAFTLATTMGLDVGIDNALFLITRHRPLLHAMKDTAEAAGRG